MNENPLVFETLLGLSQVNSDGLNTTSITTDDLTVNDEFKFAGSSSSTEVLRSDGAGAVVWDQIADLAVTEIIPSSNILANGSAVASQKGSVALTTPQNITTSSSPTFVNLNLTGQINSSSDLTLNPTLKALYSKTPTSTDELVNKAYVDALGANYLPLAGGTMSGGINMNSNGLNNVSSYTGTNMAISGSLIQTGITGLRLMNQPITSAQVGYVANMDQSVGSFDSPTFNSNTITNSLDHTGSILKLANVSVTSPATKVGYMNNMDQNVATTSNVTFNNLTCATGAFSNLTGAFGNIRVLNCQTGIFSGDFIHQGSNLQLTNQTVSPANITYLTSLNQYLNTADSPTFNGMTINGNLIHNGSTLELANTLISSASTKIGYLNNMDQNVATTSNVTFNNLTCATGAFSNLTGAFGNFTNLNVSQTGTFSRLVSTSNVPAILGTSSSINTTTYFAGTGFCKQESTVQGITMEFYHPVISAGIGYNTMWIGGVQYYSLGNSINQFNQNILSLGNFQSGTSASPKIIHNGDFINDTNLPIQILNTNSTQRWLAFNTSNASPTGYGLLISCGATGMTGFGAPITTNSSALTGGGVIRQLQNHPISFYTQNTVLRAFINPTGALTMYANNDSSNNNSLILRNYLTASQNGGNNRVVFACNGDQASVDRGHWASIQGGHVSGGETFLAFRTSSGAFYGQDFEVGRFDKNGTLLIGNTVSDVNFKCSINGYLKKNCAYWSGYIDGGVEIIASGGTATMALTQQTASNSAIISYSSPTITIVKQGTYRISLFGSVSSTTSSQLSYYYTVNGTAQTVALSGRSYVWFNTINVAHTLNLNSVRQLNASDTITLVFNNNHSGSTTYTSYINFTVDHIG